MGIIEINIYFEKGKFNCDNEDKGFSGKFKNFIIKVIKDIRVVAIKSVFF